MSTPKNQNLFNYVPPHRGAMLDGGSPSALSNDNSVDGGWSDRSTLGSSTSGHVYVPEAPYDGGSYVRTDGEWRSLFDDSFAIDSLSDLVNTVENLADRVSALEVIVSNLELSQEGWQESRIQAIETTQSNMLSGDVTFEKVVAKNNITAYVSTD